MVESTQTPPRADPRSLRPAVSAPVQRRAPLLLGAAGFAAVACLGVLVSLPAVEPAHRVVEPFAGPDGVFVDSDDFWNSSDRGRRQNPEWFAEAGSLERERSAGRTRSPALRMWTRRDDLAFVTAEMDLRFDGWTAGGEPWHGVNLWLNRTLCTPVPACSAVDDGGGNSGYALDFLNRDGSLSILKKVPGDTRARWPQGEVGVAQGGTYYSLAQTRWQPERGRTYRFGGRSLDRGNGTSSLQVLIDGKVLLEADDDGTVGGPRLTGGRLGLRSDFVALTVDDLVVQG